MHAPRAAFQPPLPLLRPATVLRCSVNALRPESYFARTARAASACAMPPSPAHDAAARPPRVLMVCLGNICRSPAAEAVLQAAAARRGLEVEVDSCGTGGGSPTWYMSDGFSYHEGDPGDARMRAAAAARGVEITSRSRPLRPGDLEGDRMFDLVVGMDRENLRAMERARAAWNKEGRCAVPEVKWRMLSEFSNDEGFRGKPVPDPYYGGAEGFEHALDLIEGAADGILDELFGAGAVGAGKPG
jgi:protein-tyrosine phosphatase